VLISLLSQDANMFIKVCNTNEGNMQTITSETSVNLFCFLMNIDLKTPIATRSAAWYFGVLAN